MTTAAQQFVTPITFQALSSQAVASELFGEGHSDAMAHINLARWADVFVVCPATANVLAKFAGGLADDLLSTIYLSSQCPVLLAPAMNQAMWGKKTVQDNIRRCQQSGAQIIPPQFGEQACGEVGVGKMAAIDDIVAAISRDSQLLQDKKVLISAGPTHEPLDPVRYLANRSSGKMGYALAQAAMSAGAEVTLVSGPVNIAAPFGARLLQVQTAAQMHQAVVDCAKQCDIYIGAAAVADYAPTASTDKIKSTASQRTIALEKTTDILASVASMPERPDFVLGFCAETCDLAAAAQNKLQSKNIDMIAANLVGKSQGGFASDYNALTVLWHGGQAELEMASKSIIAQQLIALIAQQIERAK